MEETLIKPAFQTLPYLVKDVVFVKDRYQAFLYIQNHVYPLDMYEANGNLIMVFSKTETKHLYHKWRNHEL